MLSLEIKLKLCAAFDLYLKLCFDQRLSKNSNSACFAEQFDYNLHGHTTHKKLINTPIGNFISNQTHTLGNILNYTSNDALTKGRLTN